jgi:4-amino-4-deoxy-L-arabinose transferase-like glycosyltransferase
MLRRIPVHHHYLVWIILLLLVPALFLHLGMSPLIADEATRGLVAFEMQQTGNLITPTIHGELYFNKPPLYNWIILGFFNLFKGHSEFILRLPAVISLLLFGMIIYYTTRNQLDKRVALLSSLMFVTCGRILFYDSFKGLIDLSFSMIMFLNFYLIYLFASKKKYFSLFLISYLLTSAGFLMKGLPALVFQGLTLVTAMVYLRSFRKLFHPTHLAGLAVLITLVGGYYYLLWDATSEPEFFRCLVTESTKRTINEYGIWRTVRHLFYFPVEQAYNLLPWSLMFIFLFRKSFYQYIRKNKYPGYLALVFLVNIPVYWVSVGTHPRYLFMLYPVLLILLAGYFFELKRNDLYCKVFWNTILVVLALMVVVGSWYFFSHGVSESGRAILIFCLTIALLITIGFQLWKRNGIRFELLIITLLVLRISFNLIVLPSRLETAPQAAERRAAEEIHEITRNHELLIHPVTPASEEFVYYLSTARNEILKKEYGEFREGVYYIFDDGDPLREGETKLLEFESRWKKRELRLSLMAGGRDPSGEGASLPDDPEFPPGGGE